MKYLYLIVLLFSICACANEADVEQNTEKAVAASPQSIIKPSFKTILDSAQVVGSILLFDPQKQAFYANDFEWCSQGRLPASTFKIPNSLIALETGVVENDSTLFRWNGEKRALPSWEQDLIFRDAFHFSCVPCYQEVARKIGVARMQEYLQKFQYGDIRVDSTNLDLFWLEGDAKISQLQQIDFLQRFYNAQLPITDRTFQLMKKMMVIETTDTYQLSGKTGWAVREGQDNGWFVGYVEKAGAVYFFATNVEPGAGFDINNFAGIRKVVTFQALQEMGMM